MCVVSKCTCIYTGLIKKFQQQCLKQEFVNVLYEYDLVTVMHEFCTQLQNYYTVLPIAIDECCFSCESCVQNNYCDRCNILQNISFYLPRKKHTYQWMSLSELFMTIYLTRTTKFLHHWVEYNNVSKAVQPLLPRCNGPLHSFIVCASLCEYAKGRTLTKLTC